MESPSPSSRVKPGSRHRRQVFWQITFPMILSALAGIILVILVSLSTVNGSSVSSQWASISTIWLILPLLFVGIFAFLLLAVLIFLIIRLRRILPTYTHLVHTYIQIVNIRIGIILDQAARPQINSLSRWAGWRTFWKRFWHIGERQ